MVQTLFYMHVKCRFCSHPLKHTFCDFGQTPLSNAYVKGGDLLSEEPRFPLHAYVCETCLLVQLQEFQSPDQIFSEYLYFSSYSTSWLAHAKKYVEGMVERFSYDPSYQVVEIASNDGYLLQYFQKKNIPVLGIDPARNVADVANAKGIPTLPLFFGARTALDLAGQGKKGDLIIGNNVLAHVPDINDFVKGLKILLKPEGIITLEFPHLLQLMEQNQFDTLYHEHFSYLSLYTTEKIFAAHGLKLFDVEELTTHGGSLRVYACHIESKRNRSSKVEDVLHKEVAYGLTNITTYLSFADKAKKIKSDLCYLLISLKGQGKKVVGYGAPAKGNTLLNFCNITAELLEYTVDINPHKQGLFLPGTHIPIYPPEKIKETKPDYIIILPWNLQEEIQSQMSFVRQWGCRWILPMPHVTILP